MSEQLKFYKGLEKDLPTSEIEIGGLYHCTDTGNTYRGISATEMELFSTNVGQRLADNTLTFSGDRAWFQSRIKVGGESWSDANAYEVALRNEIVTWIATDDGNGNITLSAATEPVAEEARF